MIWLIIGLVVCIVVIIYIFGDGCWDLLEKFLASLMTLFFAFLLSFSVLYLGSVCISFIADVEYEIASDTQIIALKDNQNVGGSFYIMGGYVNEDLYYYYATETEFGCKVEKIKSENSYIKYTDGNTHIEKYKPKFVNEFAYLFGLPVQPSRHIIYCPKGTVTNEFRVDLE